MSDLSEFVALAECQAALAERDAAIARVRTLIDSARLIDHSQGVGPRLFDAAEIRDALDGGPP